MDEILLGLLIGCVLSIVLLPIGILIFCKIRDEKDKERVRILIKQKKFLQPIDKRDYDTKFWDKMMDEKENRECLKNLNKKIFKNEKVKQGKGVKETESYGFKGDTYERDEKKDEK